MPPRFAYWTILADGLPTAFRATERDELMPTFQRLREKHPDAEMKWFARGKLWASPEEARAASERARGDEPRRPERPRREGEVRGKEWRPGGEHRDPRQKFKDAKKARNLEHRRDKFARKYGAGDRDGTNRGPRDRDSREPRDTRDQRPPAPYAKPHGDPLMRPPRAGAPLGGDRKTFDRDRGAGGSRDRDRGGRGAEQREGSWARDRTPRERPHGDPLSDDQRRRDREGSRHGDTHRLEERPRGPKPEWRPRPGGTSNRDAGGPPRNDRDARAPKRDNRDARGPLDNRHTADRRDGREPRENRNTTERPDWRKPRESRGAGERPGSRDARENRGSGERPEWRKPRENPKTAERPEWRKPRENRSATDHREWREPRESRGAGERPGSREARDSRGAGNRPEWSKPRESRGAGERPGSRDARDNRGAGNRQDSRDRDRAPRDKPHGDKLRPRFEDSRGDARPRGDSGNRDARRRDGSDRDRPPIAKPHGDQVMPRRRFEPRGSRGQGTDEPQAPPRPRGPNREPRPSEQPEPTPPPRPRDPVVPPPGPPERGRLVRDRKPRRDR